MDAAADFREHGSVLRLGHGDTHDLAPGLLESVDLGDRGLDIVGVGRGHRLHPDRVVAADHFVADANFAGFVPVESVLIRHPVSHPTRTSATLSSRFTIISLLSRLPIAAGNGKLTQLS